MSISLLKHREIECNGKVYSYFEDAYGTDLLVYERVGPHKFKFIKRLYIPKPRPTVILSRYFFHCHCGKMHTYSGVSENSKCKCSALLMPIVAAKVKQYGSSVRLSL